jgi:hypothetical protein
MVRDFTQIKHQTAEQAPFRGVKPADFRRW